MADFHFIRPWWFLAIIALFFALYLLKRMRVSQSGWQGLLPKHLANVLITHSQVAKPLSLAIPLIIGLLAIIAMAGPSWNKLPQPVYQLARGSVLIMDMSYSMYATDILPNRLTRARYKAIDLLDNINEGEMGLIAYAGDAFVISPLTEDINNIKILLPSLSPELMPELGSDPIRALILADEMLKNAGHIDGDIYWFTDGIENSEIQDITQWSREHTYRLNILGIGTKNGAPIKLSNGEFMKYSNGAIVVPKLIEHSLKGSAKRGNGQYIKIQNNNSDIKALVKNATSGLDKENSQQKESSNTGDQWEESGPYLIIALLPLVLLYFRRGRLLAILPLCFLLTPSESVFANTWDSLWKTGNQQAQNKFDQKQYKAAAEQFKDPLWQGSAHYKAGNFEEALKAFNQSDTAEALYNQGNTLAKLNKLDEAIASYEKALQKNPDLENAKANKELIEQLKKQQEQQKSDQNKQGDNQEEQNGDQDQSEQESQNSEENSENQQQGDSQKSNENNKQSGEQENEQSQNDENSSEEQSEQENQQQNSESEEESETSENTNEQQAQQENEAGDEQSEEQKAQAMRAAEKLAQEANQKHQQILNKVTDDPYQLLRNKMQLEYKKRRQNRSSLGATKKW